MLHRILHKANNLRYGQYIFVKKTVVLKYGIFVLHSVCKITHFCFNTGKTFNLLRQEVKLEYEGAGK